MEKDPINGLGLAQIQQRSLNETIFAKLRHAIVAGRLKPGDKLLEMELATSLGVSRSPVREAIYRLESEGLVSVRPRVGAFVTEVTQRDLEDSYQICSVLETLAIRFGLPALTDERLQILQECVKRMTRGAGNRDKQIGLEADASFHRALIEFSDSRLLKVAVQAILTTVERIRTLHYYSYLSEGGQEDLAEVHRQVFEAIRSRDEDKAVRAVADHWGLMKQRVLRGLFS